MTIRYLTIFLAVDVYKRQVAEHYGVELRSVLTGFKWIGDQIAQLEEAGEVDRFIFGFEESYGYLAGPYVRDKDAVIGSMLICEMAAYYRSCLLYTSALEGTWELSGDYNITLKTDEAEYKGIALKQWDEDGKKYVMTFTALDSKSGTAIWGSGLNALNAIE